MPERGHRRESFIPAFYLEKQGIKHAMVCFPNANVVQKKAIKLSFDKYFIGEETFLYGYEKLNPERDGD